MKKRPRKSPWAAALSGSLQRSWQRSLRSMTRAALQAGERSAKRAVRQAVKAAPPAAPPGRRVGAAKAGGRWLDGIALLATGARRYRLFVPTGVRRGGARPVVALLHGCAQDAAAIARASRAQALAAREGFLLLCPEQERLANAQGCWNWFETRSRRAFTEAASIVAAIEQVCAAHGGDPARVVVAGLSAGASMAALVALRHPGHVAAVAMHSGVAPGAAQSTASALAAMRGRREPAPIEAGALPPLLVIQGDADGVVNAANGPQAARAWAAAADARPGTPRRVQRGARYAMTITDFKHRGVLAVRQVEIAGLGHAWSGGPASEPYADPRGPDAMRLIWAFALRAFDRSAASNTAVRSPGPAPSARRTGSPRRARS